VTVFLDSSALVKRYADETGADLVRTVSDVIVMCALARVEVPAALWRKHRMGEIAAEDARVLSAQFGYDYRSDDGDLIVTRVDGVVLDRAVALVARHPLRAYDAIQLAAALTVEDVTGDCRFGCFDATLSAAASAEGLGSAWS
jgi:predicted nucleic acid-binding protein